MPTKLDEVEQLRRDSREDSQRAFVAVRKLLDKIARLQKATAAKPKRRTAK